MKFLKLLLALLVAAVFIDSRGMDDGLIVNIFATFGAYHEFVVAGLIGWLMLPWINEAI